MSFPVSMRTLTSCKSMQFNSSFEKLSFTLLKDWCDGMLNLQIHAPDKPEIHGALACPACDIIHGRCMDALYPFLYMADVTGDNKYLNAGILVFDWAENNVSRPDGSWTVVPDPNSWKGITVFGGIALAEALKFHGHLLDDVSRKKWTVRLERAADYVYNNFDLHTSNINYGFTTVYALHLFGRVLNKPLYIERSRELAGGVKDFFTKPNKLVFGEGKPITGIDGKVPVDLGYNVEESLNNVVLYALHENDEEMLDLLTHSLESHLQFMLPDGAWDNSWGTRQFKWSYWGSRTSDGSQICYGMMAGRKPVFGTAAIRTTELLKECTNEGLLHGGPHYVSHGVKPCVHHTFTHAKPLAFMLDNLDRLPSIHSKRPLPRTIADGVKEFPEISVWLLARGPWRGTLTTYDWLYRNNIQQPTGGALSLLYHTSAGLIFAGSMARYFEVEEYNQQPNPGEALALTPRIEVFRDKEWFTNLYDLNARVGVEDVNNEIISQANVTLKNESYELIEESAANFQIQYIFTVDKIRIICKPEPGEKITLPTALALPIISKSDEKISIINERKIEIIKSVGKVIVTSSVPLVTRMDPEERIFNMVPGVEAFPVWAYFPENPEPEIECIIHVL